MSSGGNNWQRTALMSVVLPLGFLAFGRSLFGLEAALNGQVIAWVALSVGTILAGLFPVRIPGTRSVISITDAFIFTSVLFFGVYPSVVLAAVDAVISTRRMTRKLASNLFSFSVMSISIFAAGSLFELLLGRPSLETKVTLDALIVPLTAMTLAHFLIDSGLVAAITAVSRRQGLFTTWVNSFLWSSVSFFSGASAAAFVYTFVRTHGFATFAMVFPILFVTYHTYKIYMEKVEEKNHHIEEMSEVYLSTIEALTMAIDAKDQLTYGHVRRVRVYAIGLGELAGLAEDEQEGIKAAALLHDIGKLAIPEHILNKPGQLSPSEFEKMKSHTVIGSEILSNVKFPYPVIPMVKYHHEWWDGTGYPEKLQGEEIPLGARVLAIADCFDAMRSPRPYHREMSQKEALAVILEGRGTHFEPRLVDLFLANIERLAEEAEAFPIAHESASSAANALPRHYVPAAQTRTRSVLDSISSAQRETKALNEMARVVGRSLSLTDTMNAILEALAEFLPFTTAVIYLQEDGTDFARARAARGRDAAAIRGRTAVHGLGSTGWALQHNRPLHNFEAGLDLAGAEGIDIDLYKCGAAYPLAVSDRVLGAITLYSEVPNQYTAEHERVMEIVTHQASVALLNAVVHEQTRARALTDDLTGLPNSRYLEDSLARRLRSRDQELNVILMDLDGFKAVNDRLGHAAGDEVLKRTAEILKGALRGEDILARIGGDEFVILANADGDPGLIRRLQALLEAHALGHMNGEQIPVGLSAGVATFPADGRDAKSLLEVADRRMYHDKKRRKKGRALKLVEAGAGIA